MRLTLSVVPTHMLVRELQKRLTASTYVVRSGDTLSEISRHMYGDATQWDRIQRENALPDPHTIQVGQTLRIPR
jgi:nucleoid-associated protein YgaU